MKRASSEEFKIAIRESISGLIAKGEIITKTAVISNAKLNNGSHVGKSTLYKKNSSNEFVHAALLQEIDVAIASQKKSLGKPSYNDKISDLKNEIAKLNKENKRLVDQVVSQESRIISSLRQSDLESEMVSSFEGEVFVLQSILTRLNPRYKGFIGSIQSYELKFRSTHHLSYLSQRIDKVVADIKHYTIFPNLVDK
ncbi:hypothetical protein PSH55_19825 [Pseudoalteromonas sp. Angola-31]|jgi:hypothetical protein|nr:hypothetical protein [Pseudoalteromonas sp. Angola-31]